MFDCWVWERRGEGHTDFEHTIRLDKRDAELFEKTLQMLKGLPELGVLLQVEKELPALIRKVFGEHGPMFSKEDMAQWLSSNIDPLTANN